MLRDTFVSTSSRARLLTAICTIALFAISGGELRAQISYTTIGSNYTQDFNSLPISPENTSLGTTANGIGWTDDNASPPSGQFSIPGWYLYHGNTQAEGGANGHQRFRIGAGTQNTGAFWSYGASGDTERALASLGSSTTTPQNIALRLTNNTGSVLGQFTLSYTGEQWRDGGAATPNAQSLTFGYAVTPSGSPPANIGALSVTSFAGLNFTSPTFTNTGSGTNLDGNNALNQSAISATVAGFVWNPGEDLWIRWNHPDAAGNDHGLALDNLTFSAGLPAEVNSVQSGLASAGTTWSDGQPAGAGKGYHVVSGHTVTLDGAFLGSKLSVENGSVDINSGGNAQFFGAMTIEASGNLTESVTGDVSIGSDTTSGLKINRDVAFNLDANSNFNLKAKLTGTGNLDLNAASPGSAANAQVFLDNTTDHDGIIRFNAGKQVNVTESASVNRLEMNSTESGGNILNWAPKIAATGAEITFNQPGTFIMNPTQTSPNLRLQSFTSLTFNAATTVDMSTAYSPGERRFLTSGFQGSGNLLVKGTPTDPTDPSGTGITLNEFEIGVQGTDPAVSQFETYSGTISTQDYINVEIRRNIPFAKLVVKDLGRVDTGAQDIPLPVNFGTQIGEVVVNGGGVFEVGFEQANAVSGVFTEGHHAAHVTLTSFGGRNGSLTLTGGLTPSTLRMQINGTDKSTQYDYIDAHGTVTLDGTLDVLINPVSCTGNDPCGANMNSSYSPTLNDTFDIINLTAVPVQGDYDVSGTVDNADYTSWQSTFGNTTSLGGGADGNRNGVIDAGDYVIWRKKLGASGSTVGSITGTFDTLNIIDPNNTLANAGFTLALDYTNPLKVQLKVVSVGSGSGLSASVPEPTSLALIGLVLPALLVRRRSR
jgi:hypothetical protein